MSRVSARAMEHASMNAVPHKELCLTGARTVPSCSRLRDGLLTCDATLLSLGARLLRPAQAQLHLSSALSNRFQALDTRDTRHTGAVSDACDGGRACRLPMEWLCSSAAATQRTISRTRARSERRANISAFSRSSSRCRRR